MWNSFNPFDPIQDTESGAQVDKAAELQEVSTHSIRYRILKGATMPVALRLVNGFNPFDPIQDTESRNVHSDIVVHVQFQPIRSDTGY